ncbi:helix-turn-helix domain-containing protein [Sphingobium lactosutens]|uniref:helix-turn-helix domain-containing protein n=1 Tax=Sphingobium lactosutens TaxID=522773 RepID=UPI002B1CC671|nr:helix-turn-helix domain-containing protein [Sphingobium lactosutens]
MTALPEDDRPPYSVQRLAERWECSPSMIRKLIDQGKLEVFYLGNLIRISAAEVEQYECRKVTHTPSRNSEEDSPSSGGKQKTEDSPKGVVVNSPRRIGRAPRRRPETSGREPTIVHGPWGG